MAARFSSVSLFSPFSPIDKVDDEDIELKSLEDLKDVDDEKSHPTKYVPYVDDLNPARPTSPTLSVSSLPEKTPDVFQKLPKRCSPKMVILKLPGRHLPFILYLEWLKDSKNAEPCLFRLYQLQKCKKKYIGYYKHPTDKTDEFNTKTDEHYEFYDHIALKFLFRNKKLEVGKGVIIEDDYGQELSCDEDPETGQLSFSVLGECSERLNYKFILMGMC